MKIKEFITRLGKYGGCKAVTGGMTIDSYLRSRVSDIKDDTIKSLVEQNKYKEDIIRDQLEKIIVDSNIRSQLEGITDNFRRSMDKADSVVQKIDSLKKQLGSENLDQSIKTAFPCVRWGEYQLDQKHLEFKAEFSNATKKLNEFSSVVKDFTNSKGGGNTTSNLLSSFQDNLNQLQALIDSFTQSQKLAIINISASITILFCLFTLIGIYFGDWIVDYFKWEEKYPRLARYFSLRRKLRTSYFIWNSLLILISVVAIIIINIIDFTNN